MFKRDIPTRSVFILALALAGRVEHTAQTTDQVYRLGTVAGRQISIADFEGGGAIPLPFKAHSITPDGDWVAGREDFLDRRLDRTCVLLMNIRTGERKDYCGPYANIDSFAASGSTNRVALVGQRISDASVSLTIADFSPQANEWIERKVFEVDNAEILGDPSFSSDGLWLTYQRGAHCYLLAANGKDSIPVGEGIFPVVSLDGQAVAYRSPAGVQFVFDRRSGERVNLGPVIVAGASWSPDGTRLVYTRAPSTGVTSTSYARVVVWDRLSRQAKEVADTLGLGEVYYWIRSPPASRLR